MAHFIGSWLRPGSLVECGMHNRLITNEFIGTTFLKSIAGKNKRCSLMWFPLR